MSASKTNFFQGIVSLLKEMSKTFTALSNRIENVEKHLVETKNLEVQMEQIVEQQAVVLKNIRSLSNLQGDIAKQIVQQHQDVEALYLALGLKKDLSYYSFNIMDAEEH